MSWATKWQIKFVSIKERTYTVNILVDGYTGSIIPLLGASNPFETREDNSEDYFTPIRTQTGYLRIFDDGKDLNGNDFDWQDLIPSNNMQHQVRLMEGTNVRWIGYMKGDLFTTQAFEYGTEYAFPIICPLSLLSVLPITISNSDGTLLSVANLIYMALSATGIEWNNVELSAHVQNWANLNARVNVMNYISVDPSVNSLTELATWTETKPFSDIMSSLCKFWGWTMYVRGLNIYIVAPGFGNRFIRFTFSQFSGVVNNQVAIYTGNTHGLESLEYMSTNHYEDYLLGRRLIEIEASCGKWDRVINPQLSELSYDWYGGEGHVISYGTEYYSIQFYLRNTTTHTEFLHNFRLVFNPINLGQGRPANILLSEDDTWGQKEEKDSFSLHNNIQCLTGGTQPSSILAQRVFSMTSLFTVCAPSGSMISISANARASLDPRDTYQFNPATDYVRMYVRIGNKYWNPDNSTWQTSPAVIQAYISSNAVIKTTKSMFNPHNGASGYCIEMTESLYGQMEVAILMSPSRDIILDNLTVKIVSEDNMIMPTTESSHQYEGIANETYAEVEELSLDIASGNDNTYGKGQIYNNDGSYLTTVNFLSSDGSSSTAMKPETKLLNRMQQAYSMSRNRLQLEVDTDIDMSLPSSRFTDNTRAYSLQSIEHDWAEDVMKITIVEL